MSRRGSADDRGVWGRLVGQDSAVETLKEAARAARAIVDAGLEEGAREDQSRAMSHAWLMTGPPGSGRSNAAKAFAAALQCTGDEPGCGVCPGCRTTMSDSNADVRLVVTESSVINTETARGLVLDAQVAPSQGRWRVIIVEDADRLHERAANALLKAIEEPPERTVWLLCAPSVEDMLTTIRSRCRHLGLRIPSVRAVADLLVGEGVADEETAMEAARAAQSHIGLARALAADPELRRKRRATLTAPVRVRSVGDAVIAAADLHDIAKKRSEERVSARDAAERAALLRQLGIEDKKAPPRQYATMIRQLEEQQKKRAKRALTDELDRALLDLMSIYRDVLMLQLGTGQELINTDLEDLSAEIAQESTPQQTMTRIEAIETARHRLVMNGQPLLVLEAMAVSLRPQVEGS
ncbi:DNA polymerase III subunit delta' [Schaalia hyovaginalis]|uniref:DNA polymerase III subunit delta' n=1 Tax=Schaalia hyovaginalis TaxID=29316 RepID=UPI0026EF63AA|nr:DNA polymerase III subunit delta' [Schaalia hyovaginalis]MDD7553241.1 DNA polymerase III subunit delta' [Schaalia hyovaginalis]MDY3093248.1 DNA polymerase III subunit delta' [Schaalia hyovaginalis]